VNTESFGLKFKLIRFEQENKTVNTYDANIYGAFVNFE
jgi:hypothetical protein